MGRKYLILFLVLCGAVDALGQENLDTLWTRRIGGAGNDVFYAMARGNDGNIFLLMYHSGTEIYEAGNYVFEYSVAGDLISSAELPGTPQFNGDERLAIHTNGDIEIIDNVRIYLFGSRGESLGTEVLQSDMHYHEVGDDWSSHYDRNTRRVYRTAAGNFVTDGDYQAWGHSGSSWGYREGPWGGIYDEESDAFTHYVADYFIETRDEAQIYGWRVDSVSGGLEVKTREYAMGTDDPLWQRTAILPAPPSPLRVPTRFVSMVDSQGQVWILSIKNPNISQQEAFFAWKIGRYDNTYEFGTREHTTFKYEFARNGAIVGMGHRNTTPPFVGVRFDVVTREYGNLWQTRVVSALDSCTPGGFVVLDDNTVVVAAPSLGNVDIILARTDTLVPNGPYFPEGYLQQFLCRLEQAGVSVRFAVADAIGLDSLTVWRKFVDDTDSIYVGSVDAYAGQFVMLDDEVPRGRTYVYYLLATDDFGRIWKVPEASDTIFVDGTVFVPTDYSLSAAYPNPFNAVTKFDYALPNQTDVSFRVYDITGRQVATLVDEFQQAGTYSVVFDASLLSTGIYVYSFEAWNYTAHGKVLLLK